MITAVRKVIVPVSDQQAALDFWTGALGFVLVRDDTYGDERWIEVGPPRPGSVVGVEPATARRAPAHGAGPAAALGPVLRLPRH